MICVLIASIGQAAEVKQVWEFGKANLEDWVDAQDWEVKGVVHHEVEGPRPPEFPKMDKENLATQFIGDGFLVRNDTGDDSFFDFKNGDEITLEAWVQLGKVRSGELMYVMGKGRSNQAEFERDNQNWALRVVVNGGLAQLSFLFATERQSDGSHWHRWTSDEGFGATTGWHHIAMCYRFGEPDSARGWIDGIPTDGAWDMGGKTEQPPVVDNDSIAIGSAVHGGKSNQLRGAIDHLAIHREILSDEKLSSRFERTGGRVAWGPMPAVMPEIGDIELGMVRVSVTEGWPDSSRWLNQGEQVGDEHTVWKTSEFLLPRLPARFDDWGIRQSWKTPVLVRLAADVVFPPGEHEFLLRTRGLSRLWIDGELVIGTKAVYRKATNLESIDPVADPPMPGGRPKGFSQQEVINRKRIPEPELTLRNVKEIRKTSDTLDQRTERQSDAQKGSKSSPTRSSSRVVLEVVVGGSNLRTETTELTVACRYEGESDYRVVRPNTTQFENRVDRTFTGNDPLLSSGDDRGTILSDAEMIPALKRIERELVSLDDQIRRQAAWSQNGFWETRHKKSQSIVSQMREQFLAAWRDRFGQATPLPTTIDQWVRHKIDQALFNANQADATQAAQFHSSVLPILRENCFRCHSEKAQGGLSLHQRDLALLAGDSGSEAVVPHDPESSELMIRITDGDMPPGEDQLSEQQIAILRTWIAEGAAWPAPPVPNSIKEDVPLIGDTAFLRRLALDTVGLPPSEPVIKAFLADQDPQKRSKMIDSLLNHEEFASHWVSFWMDLLAENPTLLNASLNSTGPFRWFLHDALRDNKSLDRMATELIMMRGSTHDGGSAGFGLAGNNDSPMAEKGHILASTFLGIELQCARCHDSPYHSTTQEDLFSLAAMLGRKPVTPPKTSRVPDEFFEKQTRESLIRVTLPLGQAVDAAWPFEEETGVLDDKSLNDLLRQPEDTRERLAALITSPMNQRFPRVVVNHLWNRLIGAGLVEPLHDWEGVSSSHPELLEWLAMELVRNDYDLKYIMGLILNSELYQRQAVGQNHGVAPEMRFFHAPDQRRLLAEQVVDSLFVATGREMKAGELTFVHDGVHPMNRRLTLGRPKRAWEFASLNNERDRPSLSLPEAQPIADVLEAFGWTGSRQKPISARDMSPNVLQPGILSNGTLSVALTRAASESLLAQIAIDAQSPANLVDQLFLRFLSRYPNDQERQPLEATLAVGFEKRLADLPSDAKLPITEKRFPQITWTNHLVPEANEVQLELQQSILAGPPADPRLDKQWREAYEDVVWSLVNHREFVWMP